MAKHHGCRPPGARIRRRVAAGTRRRRGEPGHEAEAALVDGHPGSGVDGISFTVHPIGRCRPLDEICAVRIEHSRGLTWSFPVSGAGRSGA